MSRKKRPSVEHKSPNVRGDVRGGELRGTGGREAGPGAPLAGSPSRGAPPRSGGSKEVYFSVLPDKYEPLMEEEEEEEEEERRRRRKQEKARKKKERYKKYRKNVAVAMRFAWRCLLAGLQNYAAPFSTTATVVTGPRRA